MANTTLHWGFRKIMAEFRDEGRLAVYLCYLLHANNRSRAWPSVKTLSEESGWSGDSVVEAKKWLVEHEALKPVPYAKRIGDEVALHPRFDIMEITGTIKLNDEAIPVLYGNENIGVSVGVIAPQGHYSTEQNNNIRLNRTEVTTTTSGDSEKPITTIWEEETRQPVTPLMADDLHDLVEDFTYEWVVDAIKEAVQTLGPGRFGIKYATSILARWRREGRAAAKPVLDPAAPPPQYKRVLT